MKRIKEVYLDGAANAPLSHSAYKAMKPYMSGNGVGNSFATHDYGIRNMMMVERSRAEIAKILRVDADEVLFTSGATESNNWAVKSLAFGEILKEKGGNGKGARKHVICGATEHSSVLNACKGLEDWGFDVDFAVGTGTGGALTLDDVKKAARKDTLLICAMALNNETGVRNESDEIAEFGHKIGALTLIDCTQWMSCGGKDMEVGEIFPNGDFISFSSHKLYGPTGVGCLVALNGSKKRLKPLLVGGAQEDGLRGGTTNVAGVIGMAAAMKELRAEDHTKRFRSFVNEIIRFGYSKGGFELNAVPYHPNILSLNFGETCHSQGLAELFAMKGIAVSAGSACDAEHDNLNGFNPSHVLKALGLSDDDIKNTIRVSFTKYTTKKDIARFLKAAEEIVEEQKGGNA